MKLVHLKRDETPLLPAESVLRRWASEEAGEPWALPHREAVIVVAWFLGVLLFVTHDLVLINSVYGWAQRDAFRECSIWRLR